MSALYVCCMCAKCSVCVLRAVYLTVFCRSPQPTHFVRALSSLKLFDNTVGLLL